MAATDFHRRASAPGVFRAYDLRAPGALGTWNFGYVKGAGHGWNDGAQAKPVQDEHGVRFDIPPWSQANASGSWGCKFSDDEKSNLIGPGDEIFVQSVRRWNAGMVEISRILNGGVKLFGIGTGGYPNNSFNSTNSHTKVICTTRRDGIPVLYTYPNWGLEETLPGPDYSFQNQYGARECTYVRGEKNCWRLPPDETHVLMLGIKILGMVGTSRWDCDIRLWAARLGESPILLHHYHPGVRGYVAPHCGPYGERIGRYTEFPYMTGKDTTIPHPLGQTWLQELIISRQFIEFPQLDTVPGEPMPDAISVRDKCRAAYDEACEAAGTPTVQGQIDAAVASAHGTLIAARDAAVADAAAKQAKIDAARAAAQADKDADAAHSAGQSVLDALA